MEKLTFRKIDNIPEKALDAMLKPPEPVGDTVRETPKRGWVRNVTTWQEFADSINESFGIIFNQIPVKAEIEFSNLLDPKEANNVETLIIIPDSS